MPGKGSGGRRPKIESSTTDSWVCTCADGEGLEEWNSGIGPMCWSVRVGLAQIWFPLTSLVWMLSSAFFGEPAMFRHTLRLLPLVLLALAWTASAADDFKPEQGFTSLFNGKDLTGWEYGPVPVSKKPIIE